MDIKLLTFGALLSFISLTSHATSATEEHPFNQCFSSKPEVFPAIVSKTEINARLRQFKEAGTTVVLALGAVPSEADHFDFTELGSNTGVFYINKDHHRYSDKEDCSHEMGKREWIGELVLADLNNPIHISTGLPGIFRNSVDRVVTDLNVLYFLDLSDKFFNSFSKILKVGGKMFFDYHQHLGNNVYDLSKRQMIFQINEIKATFFDEILTAESVGQKKAYNKEGYVDITLGNLYNQAPYLQCKARCIFEHEPTQEILDMVDAQYQTYLTAWAAQYAPQLSIESKFGVYPYLQTTKYDYRADQPRHYLEITRIA
jgi:hypothetical protein